MKKYLKDRPYIKKLLLIVSIFLTIPMIYTLARYISDKTNDHYLESENFYFNSNRLKTDKPLYQINNWTGVGDFTLDISLNSKKNSLLMSNFDISYGINYTCPNDVICTINKTSGIIYSATHIDNFTLTITPTRAFNDGENINIYVEASSISPYVSKISADFQIVVGKRGVSYTIDDEANRPYLLVSITNAITSYTVKEPFGTYQMGDEIDINVYRNLPSDQKQKCISATITLDFDPSVVVLDTTSSILTNATTRNQVINGITYVNQITFPIDAMSSKEVRFYKIDYTRDYSYPFGNETSIINFSAL